MKQQVYILMKINKTAYKIGEWLGRLTAYLFNLTPIGRKFLKDFIEGYEYEEK